MNITDNDSCFCLHIAMNKDNYSVEYQHTVTLIVNLNDIWHNEEKFTTEEKLVTQTEFNIISESNSKELSQLRRG